MTIQRILAIYVAPDCFGCETAREIAGVVRALDQPNLDVRVVDLSSPHAIRPAEVFAIPTYVLDGRVISLGNPDKADLLAHLGLDPHGVTG
ncbi:MAG: thioredoxin family protein [Thermomicrobiales bacterium]